MSSIRPVSTAQPVKAAQAPAAAAPAVKAAGLTGDSYQRSDIHVVTFNTAIGNSAVTTNQRDFVKLPFYQAVVKGDPNAPVMCLQEVGNAQIDEAKKLAKNGNFTVLTQRVGLLGRQNNMMLIPKRFKVQSYESNHFGWGHVKAAVKDLWDWASSFGKHKMTLNTLWQLTEPRGYQKARVIDTVTGKPLTLFNAHIAYYDPLQRAHGDELFKAVHAAEKDGPVILGGDLNTRTADCDPHPKTSGSAYVRNLMGDLQDMGPEGQPADKPNIDWVLGKGFTSVGARYYTGDSISLPGEPDAAHVSDHYAEEDVLRFE